MRMMPCALCAVFFLAQPILAEESVPLVGDPVHGKILYDKASKKTVRVNGNWINALTNRQSLKGLVKGKGGFPRVKSENLLDRYDVLSYIRSRNTDIRDIAGDATHVLVSHGEYDQYAEERLFEQGKIDLAGKKRKYRVFALYDLKKEVKDLKLVRPKQRKKRDRLKPSKKYGYVVFMPLVGFREGKHEVAFAVDPDILITKIIIRAPDGSISENLNQSASRLAGRGGRGKYDELKLVGAGKAIRQLKKPLSNAFLLGMEAVYMFEVEERDNFAFGE